MDPNIYADVDQILIDWLPTQIEVRTCAELPHELLEVLPVVRINGIGGSDPTPGLDQARVDIESFAVGLPAAKLLARQVHSLVRFRLPSYVGNGGVVALVETESSPKQLPYDNTNLRRVGATYRITVHAQP